jgi:CO/xanthine dehydrogenase Mo-binding subunit
MSKKPLTPSVPAAGASRPHESGRSKLNESGSSVPHESAVAQVAGAVNYIDDIPEVRGTLHAAPILSTIAHGRLRGVDVTDALTMPGVVDVVLSKATFRATPCWRPLPVTNRCLPWTRCSISVRSLDWSLPKP